MKTYKKILLYLLLVFFITSVNTKLILVLLPLLGMTLVLNKIPNRYYLAILGISVLSINNFNLYENSTEVFLVLGLTGFCIKKYFVEVLDIKNKLTDESKKNTYQIWGYTLVMSLESIGIYGFLGYNYFLYNESTIGLLKVLVLGVFYNYSQSSFIIKKN